METKQQIFKRYPPGDRWVSVDSPEGPVFGSLTLALENYYQHHGLQQYYINAVEGFIYKVETVMDVEPPIKKFSMYGDY